MQQCREVTSFKMTNTEKLIYQLLEDKESYKSTLWNHPTLMMNSSAITTPLTTLPYASDTEAAVKLNEVSNRYCLHLCITVCINLRLCYFIALPIWFLLLWSITLCQCRT